MRNLLCAQHLSSLFSRLHILKKMIKWHETNTAETVTGGKLSAIPGGSVIPGRFKSDPLAAREKMI